MVVRLPQIEGVVMLAFDVSASMAAEDVEPTRMNAAKAAAQVFVEERPDNIKIGVVSFSDGGLVVQPPTDDEMMIDATILRLVPQSGTSMGQGILAALNAISAESERDPSENEVLQGEPEPEPIPRGTFAPAIIVLLTDGENTTPPDPIESAQTAISQGVRIFTVGVGSTTGTALEIEGFNVFTQLNEEALNEIALLTEGEYFKAENEEELGRVYDELKTQFVVKPEKMEITSILAGISILVLLIGSALSLLWFGRIA
jgi:Ca-activated chloride channel family protein